MSITAVELKKRAESLDRFMTCNVIPHLTSVHRALEESEEQLSAYSRLLQTEAPETDLIYRAIGGQMTALCHNAAHQGFKTTMRLDPIPDDVVKEVSPSIILEGVIELNEKLMAACVPDIVDAGDAEQKCADDGCHYDDMIDAMAFVASVLGIHPRFMGLVHNMLEPNAPEEPDGGTADDSAEEQSELVALVWSLPTASLDLEEQPVAEDVA